MPDEQNVDSPDVSGEIEIVGRTPAAEGQPYLRIGRTSNYKWLWNDQLIWPLSHPRVTLYRPEPQEPAYKVVGHYAQPDANTPHGSTTIVEAINDEESSLLKEPYDYDRVWTSEGSNCKNPGAIWRPVPHDNFVVMGHVATTGFDKPPLDIMRCVHISQVENSRIAGKIYSDQGTHSRSDFTLYSVEDLPGVFVSQPNYKSPTIPTFRFKKSLD